MQEAREDLDRLIAEIEGATDKSEHLAHKLVSKLAKDLYTRRKKVAAYVTKAPGRTITNPETGETREIHYTVVCYAHTEEMTEEANQAEATFLQHIGALQDREDI
jgi:hypothetical protein